MGPESEGKHPYFFMSGSAGTGKTFMTLKVVDMVKSKKINYLLLTPTGVAAQNVGGKTIHSALRMRQMSDHHYQTLSIESESLMQVLLQIRVVIIDEGSMVSNKLFSFLSNIFGSVHQNHKVSGRIPVLMVDDLFQLPPMNGEHIFFSPAWKSFFPLFLTKPQRQRGDLDFTICLKS
jgi:Cdc6-like AAA superfamily ATPase